MSSVRALEKREEQLTNKIEREKKKAKEGKQLVETGIGAGGMALAAAVVDEALDAPDGEPAMLGPIPIVQVGAAATAFFFRKSSMRHYLFGAAITSFALPSYNMLRRELRDKI